MNSFEAELKYFRQFMNGDITFLFFMKACNCSIQVNSTGLSTAQSARAVDYTDSFSAEK